ncbi:MAG: radical SAM/SPASM domain-containing protein [Myxococcota bacterium]
MSGAPATLQLHPARRCDLACGHCYARSGPLEPDEVPLGALETTVEDAVAGGWTAVEVSGGEPLLWRGLERLLQRARAAGATTSITTNGTRLPRVLDLAPHLDRVVVSIDGIGVRHDRMRGKRGAFDDLVRDLPVLRGIPFEVRFTLTRDNGHELADVVALAAAHGARAVQVAPLADVGRVAADGLVPTDEDTARAWYEAIRRRWTGADGPRVELDGMNLAHLSDPGASLSDWLSPLVVEADGTVVPFQHGFPRRWRVGSVHDARLSELLARWPHAPALRALCRAAVGHLRATVDLPFVDGLQRLVEAAGRASLSSAA